MTDCKSEVHSVHGMSGNVDSVTIDAGMVENVGTAFGIFGDVIPFERYFCMLGNETIRF